MLAGIISDTHGYINDRLLPYFASVDVILHAGDVGGAEVLQRLEQLAPVVAVEGNNDAGLKLGLQERLHLVLEGHNVQIVHQRPHAEPGSDIVIFGHSHQMVNEQQNGVLWLNPGAAGRRGFHKLQSIALLRLELGQPAEAELIVLGPRLPIDARSRRSSR